MNNKKGIIDRNALGIWMLIFSFIVMFLVFNACSTKPLEQVDKNVKDTYYKMHSQYTLITFLNSPVLLEAETAEYGKGDLLKKIYDEGWTFGEMLDMFYLEEKVENLYWMNEIFLAKAKERLEPIFHKEDDSDMYWDMEIKHSDGSMSMCEILTGGEQALAIIKEPDENAKNSIKLCFDDMPSADLYERDAVSAKIPSRTRGITFDVKLIVVKHEGAWEEVKGIFDFDVK